MEERIVRADPVAEPQEYQSELLALLGGEDPVTVLATTTTLLRERFADVPADQLTRRPEPHEWSPAELLGHLWDAEIAHAFRARLILAQDQPELTGYDQDAWATLPKPAPGVLVEAFVALREANLVLARGAAPEAWERWGMHSERGRTTYRLLLETMAGHDRAHLEQLRRALAP
jgi:DinB superfamily